MLLVCYEWFSKKVSMTSSREKVIVLFLSACSFGLGVYAISQNDGRSRSVMFVISVVLLLFIAARQTINKIGKGRKR